MKTTFVIITVDNRIEDLDLLLHSIKAQSRFDSYDVNIMFQGNVNVLSKIAHHRSRIENIFTNPNRLGCHTARLELLKRIKYDVYINLDDDMELMDITDYSKCVERAMTDPSVGFMLTNWARTRKLALAKIPKMRDEFKPQIMCYNGGGMVYNDSIAELMRQLPPMKATFDNAWALTSYINGYTNYRYMGSVAIHRICTTGGMNEFMKSNEPVLMMGEYIDFKKAKRQNGTGMDYLIPLDKDVNQKARDEHKLNKK